MKNQIVNNVNLCFFFQTLKECYERVCANRNINESEPKRRNAANFKVELLCRDDTTLVVKIVDDHDKDLDLYDVQGNRSGNLKYLRKKGEKGNLYMVKVERGNLMSQKYFYIVSNGFMFINVKDVYTLALKAPAS